MKLVKVVIQRRDADEMTLEVGKERLDIAVGPGVLIVNEKESMSATSPRFTRMVVPLEVVSGLLVYDIAEGEAPAAALMAAFAGSS